MAAFLQAVPMIRTLECAAYHAIVGTKIAEAVSLQGASTTAIRVSVAMPLLFAVITIIIVHSVILQAAIMIPIREIAKHKQHVIPLIMIALTATTLGVTMIPIQATALV